MHHIGWSLPLAFFRPINVLPPSEGRPEGSLHPAQRLRGRYPLASHRGHASPSCRGHSTSSRDSSCAERAKLVVSTGPPLRAVVRASGCATTAGAIAFLTPLF